MARPTVVQNQGNQFSQYSDVTNSRLVSSSAYLLRLLPGISFLLTSTLPVHSPAFFQNLSRFFPVLAVADTWFLCRPAE